MFTILLYTGALLFALIAVGVVLIRVYQIQRGVIIVDPSFDGPQQVSLTLHAILRYMLRRSIHVRKFLTQYMLHVFVRGMFYLDKGFSYLYARSRNSFVKNAVRNRGTVPHFWNHLKVYKQEMDKEKEENE